MTEADLNDCLAAYEKMLDASSRLGTQRDALLAESRNIIAELRIRNLDGGAGIALIIRRLQAAIAECEKGE